MQFLCLTTDLDNTRAKSLTIEINGQQVDIFLARNKRGIYAYLDVCPHAGTPLEWQADRFFEETGTYLMCATHGAHFQVHDGRCVAGPCLGDALTPLPIRVKDEKIYLNNNK